MGIFRVGFLDNILSRPLLSGFVNAVAIIIFINQLEPFLGLPASNVDQAWQKVAAVVTRIQDTHLLTVLFGSCCLAILITLRVVKWRFPDTRWLKYIIDPFLIVCIGIAFSFGFNLEKHGVRILRDFPNSLPIPTIPNIRSVDLLQVYFVDAIVICIVGTVSDSIRFALEIILLKFCIRVCRNHRRGEDLCQQGALRSLNHSLFWNYFLKRGFASLPK